MFYLTQMLGKPVVDAAAEVIGEISDVAIATGEVFPRVTSLAFLGPGKTPFMLSWRKYVESIDDERIALNAPRAELRFSYLQPDEVLLHRDLLNKQIVDTQGMKVVRVNDLKLSESRNQLRLLGADVGMRGILRGLAPGVERLVARVTGSFGHELGESLIAWNYMDLLDRDLSHVRLSVTHKRLHELHPADIADVLEQLTPSQRARVFEHLDNAEAALAVAELEDEIQADVIDDLGSQRASDILEMMDPDDAADIIGDLPYEKAEALLRLMGVQEARAVRSLLGYKEKTAGGIMTPEVTTVTEDMTAEQVIEHLRHNAAEAETIYYIYVVEEDGRLDGVISLRDLVMANPQTQIADIVSRDLITVGPDDDQEDVAEAMSKYDLLALPVVEETGKLLGIVTVDDALEVMEEESAEDLELASGTSRERGSLANTGWWLLRRGAWVFVWAGAALVYFALRATLEPVITEQAIVAPAVGLLFSGYALVLMPVALRIVEDISSRSLAELIEGADPETRPSLWARLWREFAIGLLMALVAGALAYAFVYLGSGGAALFAAPFAVATALATLVSVLAGAVLGHAELKRSAAGKRVSGTRLAVTAMLLCAAIYLAIAYTGGALWATASAAPGG